MTQEEKAKRYDEALERASNLHKDAVEMENNMTTKTCEIIFPELKESEDDRIRKVLIRFHKSTIDVDGIKGEDIIAWLEKQGEHKPTDKVGPKFHEGDWVVSNLDGKARQISEVHFDEYNSYYVVEGKSVNLEEYDRLHHLWTIQDAKDGDVLAGHETIVLFKKIEGQNIRCYCTYHFMNNPHFYVDTLQSKNPYCPATKEQRDLLFAKMKEAVYVWDAEKKELKKIEQKPVEWSEEDEQYLLVCKNALNRYQMREKRDAEIISKWLEEKLKSIRPQSQWKPSEEQINAIGMAITFVTDDFSDNPTLSEILKDLQNQLKAL